MDFAYRKRYTSGAVSTRFKYCYRDNDKNET